MIICFIYYSVGAIMNALFLSVSPPLSISIKEYSTECSLVNDVMPSNVPSKLRACTTFRLARTEFSYWCTIGRGHECYCSRGRPMRARLNKIRGNIDAKLFFHAPSFLLYKAKIHLKSNRSFTMSLIHVGLGLLLSLLQPFGACSLWSAHFLSIPH